MRRLLVGTALFVGLAGTNPLVRYQDNATMADLTEYINFKMDRDHIPGLAALIVQNDRIVWSCGFSFQDVAKKTAMMPQTVAGTASITKIAPPPIAVM